MAAGSAGFTGHLPMRRGLRILRDKPAREARRAEVCMDTVTSKEIVIVGSRAQDACRIGG
ncbi:MAG: hypothetical protein BWY79_00589 [Actinobacteria bacterium ADurb.Bin444]|nr:MAG: hypothetical protein BWY79_00589 [Actinobacteria bacterium ADurb.Bin444]